jgi:hypothetical protein
MHVTMAAGAGRQFHPGHAPHTLGTVHTYGLFGDHVAMTYSTVHRIETAPVPALGADVAVEAFGRAMNCGLELCEVNFVAIVAGICLFFVARV